MYNWSTDEKELKKDKETYAVWKLEQAVNFGLNEESFENAYGNSRRKQENIVDFGGY